MQEEIQAVQRIVDMIVDFFVRYSFQVAGAIIVLVVGWLVARAIASFVLRFLEKKELDITLRSSFNPLLIHSWAPPSPL